MPQPEREKFIDDLDELILEDELQRIVLIGNVEVASSLTGIVVAVCGIEHDDNRGKFVVDDICYYPLPPQISRPLPTEDQ